MQLLRATWRQGFAAHPRARVERVTWPAGMGARSLGLKARPVRGGQSRLRQEVSARHNFRGSWSVEPMASVQEIRQRLRGERIKTLRRSIEPLLGRQAGAEVWLYGSLARGDWDARSDVDLLAIAADQNAADQLAEELLATGLADDVIGLSQGRWLEHQRGGDPWWRGICRDAIRLQPILKP